jgi:hypothetical protein
MGNGAGRDGEAYQHVMFSNGSYYYTHDSLAKFIMCIRHLIWLIINPLPYSTFAYLDSQYRCSISDNSMVDI